MTINLHNLITKLDLHLFLGSSETREAHNLGKLRLRWSVFWLLRLLELALLVAAPFTAELLYARLLLSRFP